MSKKKNNKENLNSFVLIFREVCQLIGYTIERIYLLFSNHYTIIFITIIFIFILKPDKESIYAVKDLVVAIPIKSINLNPIFLIMGMSSFLFAVGVGIYFFTVIKKFFDMPKNKILKSSKRR